VTGIPNSGKSEWLDALAVNLAELHGWRFALCSMEKRARDHARQLLEKRARRPMLWAAYAGGVPRMTEDELGAAFAWLDDHFVVIEAADDDAMPSIEWVMATARAAALK
jgi:twinkle protein